MTNIIAMIGSLLLVVFPARTQDDSKQNKIQVIATGEITSIDLKKQILRIRDGPNPNATNRSRRDNIGARGATSDGGIRLPNGVDLNWPGGSDPASRNDNRGRVNQAREYKVFITGSTVMKEGEKTIELSDLKVGDHLLISGPPKGNDVEATEISRNPNSDRRDDEP